jgi:hypothetical protein
MLGLIESAAIERTISHPGHPARKQTDSTDDETVWISASKQGSSGTKYGVIHALPALANCDIL